MIVDPRPAAILRTERGPTMTCSPRLAACRSNSEYPRQRTVENFGRIGLVDHIIVQAGPLAAPGEWLSEAPHLVRAILDDRVRIRGLPRHKGRYIGRPGTRGSTTRTPQETLADRSSRPRTLRPRHLERRSDPRRTSKYRGKRYPWSSLGSRPNDADQLPALPAFSER